MPHRLLLPFLILLLCWSATGCVALPYGLYEDKRAMGTIIDDKAVATGIKSQLMSQNFMEGFSVSVYCFGGRVFLVGNVPDSFREKAIEIAREAKGVQSVTAHWFSGPASTLADLDLEMKLTANLIAAKGVSSTQVNLEVHAGQVVVLGMVPGQGAADRVLHVIRATAGVTDVVSFMIVQ